MIQRQRVVSLAAVRTARIMRSLLGDLEAFCLGLPEYELERAQELFFGPEELEEAGAEPESAFVDWLAFDYRISTTGETVLELFMAARPAEEQALLAEWVSAPVGLFRVLRLEGSTAFLETVAGGGPAELAVEWPEGLQGDYVIARWLPVGDLYWHGLHTMVVPGETVPSFKQALDTELARMRRSQPGAEWQDLFQERQPLVRDLLAVVGVVTEEGRPLPQVVVDGPSVCGETEPTYFEVAFALDAILAQTGVPWDDRQYAMGLWWDIAYTLQPRIREPLVWAAVTADVWYRSVMGFDVTGAEIADDFDVSAAGVAKHRRKVLDQLNVEPLDDRYTPPLYSMERRKILGQYMSDWSPPAAPPLPEALRWFKPELLGMVDRLNQEAADLVRAGDLEGARKRLTEALSHCPVYPPVLINLAQIAVLERDVTGAIPYAEAALEAHPGYPVALAVLAGCHARLGRRDFARLCLSEALTIYQQWNRLYPAFVRQRPEVWEEIRVAAELVGDQRLLTQAMKIRS